MGEYGRVDPKHAAPFWPWGPKGNDITLIQYECPTLRNLVKRGSVWLMTDSMSLENCMSVYVRSALHFVVKLEDILQEELHTHRAVMTQRAKHWGSRCRIGMTAIDCWQTLPVRTPPGTSCIWCPHMSCGVRNRTAQPRGQRGARHRLRLTALHCHEKSSSSSI